MHVRRVLARAAAATMATAIATTLAATAAPAQTTFAPNSTTPPVISTFAGNGVPGFKGDGGSAISAEVRFPIGVAEDSAGDVYVADTLNSRVRLVKPNGVISTVAGNGAPAFGGDGGPATKAELNGPQSPAVDSQGNLYIADTGNNRVRKVSPAGIITTFAGTGKCAPPSTKGVPATTAGLCAPTAVAIAPNGMVLIVDTANNVVRSVNQNGIINTFAGTGKFGYSGDGMQATKAMLAAPTSIAVDRLDNAYIADTANNRVREVLPNGMIETLAGAGTGGYSGDGGPAAKAALNTPLGVGVDSLGNVYIADSFNFRIRVVIPKGDIFTYAGTGVPGYSGDGGPATAAKINVVAGNLAVDANDVYFADGLNQRIRRIQGGPPPNVPETPLAIYLPLGALAILAGGFVLTRRRSHRRPNAILEP